MVFIFICHVFVCDRGNHSLPQASAVLLLSPIIKRRKWNTMSKTTHKAYRRRTTTRCMAGMLFIFVRLLLHASYDRACIPTMFLHTSCALLHTAHTYLRITHAVQRTCLSRCVGPRPQFCMHSRRSTVSCRWYECCNSDFCGVYHHRQ